MKSVLDWGISRLTRVLTRIDPRVPVVSHWPGARRVAGGISSHFIRPARKRILLRLTMLHRRRLRDVIFIGVTGSTGKTTTKDLIAAVAWSHLRGVKSREQANLLDAVAWVVRRISPRDQFAVVEVGTTGPGTMAPTIALVRPRIGVVTSVASDHYSAFGSLAAIADEKRTLIEALPPTGTAVLNSDDARVLAMKEGFRGRVVTFGLSPDATVRAEAVSAVWPDRLAFTVVYEGRRVFVQTQLCGGHWVHAALAAIAVGLALGVPLEAAARSLGEVAPFTGRMCPVPLPDGVTFIRDDWKASMSTIPVTLAFMRPARAKRKVAIIGTISDTMGDAGAVYVNMARSALESADHVIFVGPRAFSSLRAKANPDDNRIRAFSTVKAAATFCNSFLEPGDLVLLKGSNAADHLYRIILTRTTSVACWLADCKKKWFCDECSLLTVPSDVELKQPAVSNVGVSDAAPLESPSQVLVGLGNPDDALRKTPHNVGHLVVNRIAELLDASWTRTGDAFLAWGEWRGERVGLVRLTTAMNLSGPSLRELSGRLGFGPEQCILIQDDLDLPLGTIRTRMRGSDGGHRGVRSILEAFQSDQFRRVKVGVRREGEARRAADAVLSTFTPEEYSVIDGACNQAVERADQLVAELRRLRGAQAR